MKISSAVPNIPSTGPAEGPPKSITKAELQEMKQRATESGREAPAGIDTLIAKFDEAAGKGGSMTRGEFKAFATANGVEPPKPPAGGKGPQGAGGPPSGARPQGAAGAGGSKSSSTSNVATQTDDELRTAAANGDQAAIRELAKREAAKEAAAKAAAEAAAEKTPNPDGTGSVVDVTV